MSRFFFDVHDGVALPDTEGSELSGIEEAKIEAVRLSGTLLREQPALFWTGETWSIDVRDEGGLILFSLAFLAIMSPVLMAPPTAPA